MHTSTFFDHKFLYNSSFFGAQLHNGDRLNLSIHADKVVELIPFYITDAQAPGVYAQRCSMISEHNPRQQQNDSSPARDVWKMFLPYSFLFFQQYIHDGL